MVGAGILGLSTATALVDAGARVTCFEAIAPMSQRSFGATRMFRMAHPHPELVELASRARHRWSEWEELTGRSLVDRSGTMICGGDLDAWAAAMETAGARHQIVDAAVAGKELLVRSLAAPVLVDPAGGVIDVRRTGELLVRRIAEALVRDPVCSLEQADDGVRVGTERGWSSFDSCVIAAGARTPLLAGKVGIDVPQASAHHARFTFALRDAGARSPCLIDRSECWRPGFTTYQHMAAPGRWAIGAHLPTALTRWERGRTAVVDDSRRLVANYVRDCVPSAREQPIEELYCDIADDWSDGFAVKREGGFLALYGDNLFKLAPALGEILANAALSGATPASIGLPA